MSSIIETGIDYKKITDVKYMKTYIMQLNEDISYMIYNIDLDNFSAEGAESYLARDNALSSLTTTTERLQAALENSSKNIKAGLTQLSDSIDLYVSAGDVTNQINISSDKIKISASRLHVYSDNFYLDDDTLKINGTIIAKAGSVGGFEISTDSSGNQYLAGPSGSTMTAGSMTGTVGKFGTFTCNGLFYMLTSTLYLENCVIASTGLQLLGGWNALDFILARYNESSDIYSSFMSLTVKGGLWVENNMHVGRNGDDSGTVTCYSVISSFEGEKPGDDEDSDIVLKKELEPIDEKEALQLIEDTKTYTFNFIGESERRAGVIAQEAAELEEKYGDLGIVDDEEEYLAVSYTRYIPIMAAALKETDRLIEEVRHGI